MEKSVIMKDLIRHKVILRDNQRLINDLKELMMSAADNNIKNECLHAIFEAYQFKHDQIQMAKEKYPLINWMSLAIPIHKLDYSALRNKALNRINEV